MFINTVIYGYNIYSIILLIFLIGQFISYFINPFCNFSGAWGFLYRALSLLIILFLPFGVDGIYFLPVLFLSVFTFWIFLFGLLSSRRNIYILALLFLILVPVTLGLNLDKLAENIAILSYLCLLLGVIKDIFYEKIYK